MSEDAQESQEPPFGRGRQQTSSNYGVMIETRMSVPSQSSNPGSARSVSSGRGDAASLGTELTSVTRGSSPVSQGPGGIWMRQATLNPRGGGEGACSHAGAPPGGQRGHTRSTQYMEVPGPNESVTKQEEDEANYNATLSSDNVADLETTLPLRTSFDDLGTSVVVAANYFELSLNSAVKVYKYGVTFRSKVGPALPITKRQRNRLLELLLGHRSLQRHGNAIATDYNEMLYTREEIELPHSLTLKYWEGDASVMNNPKEYTATLAMIVIISIADFEAYLKSRITDQAAGYDHAVAVTALNTVISKAPNVCPDLLVLGGNRFFSLKEETLSLGEGVVAMRGFYASVRPTNSGALLNVHTQTSAFYEPVTAWSLMNKHGTRDLERLVAFLKKVRVKTRYMKDPKTGAVSERVKTIFGVSDRNANELKFPDSEGKSVSVSQYFQEVHKINLAHPEAFLLDMGTIKHDQAGKPLEEPRQIWLPPELAQVLPGQLYLRRLSPSQTDQMLRHAARNPADNIRQTVVEGLPLLGLQIGGNSALRSFGLNIKDHPMTVPARSLEAPKLKYKSGTRAAKGADWNLSGMKVARPNPILNTSTARPSLWGIFFVHKSPSAQHVKDLEKMLVACDITKQTHRFNELLDLDLRTLESHQQVEQEVQNQKNDSEIEEKLSDKAKQGVKIVLIVIPNKIHARIYSKIKLYGDCKSGIHTVCTIWTKFAGGDKSLLGNLALKINAKLGGTNHHVENINSGFLKTRTMIIGIDVVHPGEGSIKGTPSVAAVVASMDPHFTIWPGTIWLQGRNDDGKVQEIVQKLSVMIEGCLKTFQRRNKAFPDQILVYRDGVSESQYDQVRDIEFPQIVAACKAVNPSGDRPPITILLAAKRHHTRLFKTEPSSNEDNVLVGKSRLNTGPGTLADHGIMAKHQNDFYLQSHASRLGTARPAHYVPIIDEIGRSANEYHKATFHLSHQFARATKAVSYCTPAKYADLLCERAKSWLYDYYFPHPSRVDEVWDIDNSPITKANSPHERLREDMFYL